MRKMPAQKPGRSRQDYETPLDFIDAVCKKFLPPNKYAIEREHAFDFDLAASAENTKGKNFFDKEGDAFSRERWALLNAARIEGNTLWLNPPFGDIGKWAYKCKQTAQDPLFKAQILFLVPASVGARWFEQHVNGWADIYFLGDRITFAGAKQPYIKDCMLCVYRPLTQTGGARRRNVFRIWRWKSA